MFEQTSLCQANVENTRCQVRLIQKEQWQKPRGVAELQTGNGPTGEKNRKTWGKHHFLGPGGNVSRFTQLTCLHPWTPRLCQHRRC